MKKYKVYFSILNLTRASQEEVTRLQAIWTGFSAPIIGSTYIASNALYALVAAISCGIIDKLIACLYFEEKTE